jgi:hypothetical protein
MTREARTQSDRPLERCREKRLSPQLKFSAFHTDFEVDHNDNYSTKAVEVDMVMP